MVEINKVSATIEEINASYNFVALGLKSLKEQNSSITNNHVTLQLFASGFERLVKILLILKEKHLTGKYPEFQKTKDRFKNYNNGHGIEKMLGELLSYRKTVDAINKIPMLREELEYIEMNKHFRVFLKIITEFSIQQRYYYIDTIVSDKPNLNFNPFAQFKAFIYSFGDGEDLSQLSYEQEERQFIHKAIVCIERGVRAISQFFIHCLGDIGRQHYQEFSNFILLNDKDLGSLKYTEKKILPNDSYKPINALSLLYLRMTISAKAKVLYSKNHTDWAFTIDEVKVFSFRNRYFFARIGNQIFALTGTTSSHYKTPIYLSSFKLKPKAVATYLLEEAKKIGKRD